MFSKNFTKILAGSAGAVVLASSVAACGGGGSTSEPGPGSGSDTNGVVVQAGRGVRLSGTYSALDMSGWIPDSMYPSGIDEVPGGAYNTNSLVSVNAKYNPATDSCSTVLDETGGPGWGEQAYLIDQGQNAAKTDFYSYAAYEFLTAADATRYVKVLAAKYAACGTFTVNPDNGTSFPATLSIGPASQAEVAAANTAVDLRQSATYNGKTVVGDDLVATDGNVVVVVAAASDTGALPTGVSATRVAEQILTAFAANEAQWVSNHVPSDYTTSTAAPAEPDSGDRITGTVAWGGGLS